MLNDNDQLEQLILGNSHYDHYVGNYGTSISPEANYVYVRKCVFERCHSLSNGGSIYYKVSNGNLLLYYSSFNNCTADNYGAAFYSYSSYGSFAFTKCCIYGCKTEYQNYIDMNTWGITGAAFISYVGVSQINYALDSSVSYCAGYYHPILLRRGHQNIQGFNHSNNIAKLFGWGTCCVQANENCGAYYSTYCNNYAWNSRGIGFGSYNPICYIESCNVVGNKQKTNERGGSITTYESEIIIKNCCIMKNTGGYVFYAYEPGDKVIVYNTTCDGMRNTGGSVSLNTIYASTPSFVNELLGYSTGKCVAEKISIEGIPTREITYNPNIIEPTIKHDSIPLRKYRRILFITIPILKHHKLL